MTQLKLTRSQRALLHRMAMAKFGTYLWVDGSDLRVARKLAPKGLVAPMPGRDFFGRQYTITTEGRAALEQEK